MKYLTAALPWFWPAMIGMMLFMAVFGWGYHYGTSRSCQEVESFQLRPMPSQPPKPKPLPPGAERM